MNHTNLANHGFFNKIYSTLSQWKFKRGRQSNHVSLVKYDKILLFLQCSRVTLFPIHFPINTLKKARFSQIWILQRSQKTSRNTSSYILVLPNNFMKQFNHNFHRFLQEYLKLWPWLWPCLLHLFLKTGSKNTKIYHIIRDHSFSTHAEFSNTLTLLTPCYAHCATHTVLTRDKK